jgi:hypothetical protein
MNSTKRKPGRPRVYPVGERTANVVIELPVSEVSLLRAYAAITGASVTAAVRRVMLPLARAEIAGMGGRL